MLIYVTMKQWSKVFNCPWHRYISMLRANTVFMPNIIQQSSIFLEKKKDIWIFFLYKCIGKLSWPFWRNVNGQHKIIWTNVVGLKSTMLQGSMFLSPREDFHTWAWQRSKTKWTNFHSPMSQKSSKNGWTIMNANRWGALPIL